MLWIIVAVLGTLMGVLVAVSPLSVAAAVLAALVVKLATHGLTGTERTRLALVLVVAIAVRFGAIAALNVTSARVHSYHSARVLFGDESYAYDRALRHRELLQNVRLSKYDYEIVYDTFGRTGYLTAFTWVQAALGPAPYGMRALNAVIFVAAAAMLFRLAQPVVGGSVSLIGLTVLVCLPSLFFWSISLLKESVYFFLTASCLTAGVVLARSRTAIGSLAALAVIAVALYFLSDLRPDALALTAAPVAIGLTVVWLGGTRTRLFAAALVGAVLCVMVAVVPSIQRRALAAITRTAKQHLGHVFTEGHDYKTLDPAFYAHVQTPATMRFTLTAGEAGRYVARSIWAFATMPLPWQIETRREAAFLPEQIVWYILLITAGAGVWLAWRRDRPFTAILISYVIVMALVLALTNGNVGTLVRLRGLVTPFLVWFSALGLAAVLVAAMKPRWNA